MGNGDDPRQGDGQPKDRRGHSPTPVSGPGAPGCLTQVLGVLSKAAFLLILLWNWDSFWQQQSGPLARVQKRYFPEKYHREQMKLEHIRSNNLAIAELKSEIQQRKAEIQQLTREAEAGKQVCSQFESALYIIDILRNDLSPKQAEQLRDNCTNRSCEEVLDQGKALLTPCK